MSLLLRVQALAYTWLGLFYQQQRKGLGAARKCFQRALAIEPQLAIAGEAWPPKFPPLKGLSHTALLVLYHRIVWREGFPAAGEGLMRILRQAGAAEAAAELCKDIAEQYPEASWAQQQLGFLALERGQAEEAVAALQAALRRNPAHAPAWEALGAAYHELGRFTASLKVVPCI